MVLGPHRSSRDGRKVTERRVEGCMVEDHPLRIRGGRTGSVRLRG